LGALYYNKMAVKSLIEWRGIVLVTSSHAGYASLLGRTGFSASKRSLDGLSESLRAGVKDMGIHVLMLWPAVTIKR